MMNLPITRPGLKGTSHVKVQLFREEAASCLRERRKKPLVKRILGYSVAGVLLLGASSAWFQSSKATSSGQAIRMEDAVHIAALQAQKWRPEVQLQFATSQDTSRDYDDPSIPGKDGRRRAWGLQFKDPVTACNRLPWHHAAGWDRFDQAVVVPLKTAQRQELLWSRWLPARHRGHSGSHDQQAVEQPHCPKVVLPKSISLIRRDGTYRTSSVYWVWDTGDGDEFHAYNEWIDIYCGDEWSQSPTRNPWTWNNVSTVQNAFQNPASSLWNLQYVIY